MGVITLIAGSAGLAVAGFVGWYTLWHRRVEAAFEKVPVSRGRSAHVLRRGVALGSRPDCHRARPASQMVGDSYGAFIQDR